MGYQQTVSSQILGQVLALAAISTPGHRNAMLLRSGATLVITTTTHAGTETTVSSRSTSGTAALVCAICPTMPGSGSADYGTSSGSGFSCFEPYEQACNATEMHCDAGYDSEGCWYGNYCINQVNEWDGCYGVCGMNCNWETEDWCDMGTDSNGCWMGNWCQDKSMGGCPAPMGGSEVASGEDICAHMTWTEECGASQISCDSGYSYEGCWFGNYCT